MIAGLEDSFDQLMNINKPINKRKREDVSPAVKLRELKSLSLIDRDIDRSQMMLGSNRENLYTSRNYPRTKYNDHSQDSPSHRLEASGRTPLAYTQKRESLVYKPSFYEDEQRREKARES